MSWREESGRRSLRLKTRRRKGPARARRSSSAPASSCSTRFFASRSSRSPTARSRPKTFSSSVAAARRTRPLRWRGWAAARRSPARWADRPARTATATSCWRRSRASTSTAAPVSASTGWRPGCRRFSSTARGDRTIVTYRDQRIAAVMPGDADSVVAAADLVLADNRYPQYVRPICEAARHAQAADRARRRQGNGRRRCAVSHRFAYRVFRGVPAGDDRPQRSGRRACGDRAADRRLPCGQRRAERHPVPRGRRAAPPAGVRRSARWIRSVPATPCMPDSHWRWPKDIAKPTHCGSVPRSPASSAPASAAPPARRSGPRSRRSWPNVAWYSPPDAWISGMKIALEYYSIIDTPCWIN